MTVRDLIERLSKFNFDLVVCVDGYEGGVQDLLSDNVREIGVDLDVNEMDCVGPHEENKNSSIRRLLIGR